MWYQGLKLRFPKQSISSSPLSFLPGPRDIFLMTCVRNNANVTIPLVNQNGLFEWGRALKEARK